MKRKSIYHDVIFHRQAGAVHERAFMKRFCAHPSIIGRLKLDKKLRGHNGCVNTIAFSPEGSLVITGSDDTQLMVWDAESGERKINKNSGHHDNIFSARFVPMTNNNEVVSCAADGQVRWNHLSRGAGGGNEDGIAGKLLARHEGRAHRLSLSPGTPSSFYSCGEDGVVYSFDLRRPHKRLLLTLMDDGDDVLPIYAMSVNPVQSNYFILGGTSTYVRLYDARQPSECVGRFCPKHMRSARTDHITGTAFSYDGRELLATYNDELIYRFDGVADAVCDEGENGGSGGGGGAAAAAAAAAAGERRSRKRPVGVRAVQVERSGSRASAAAAVAAGRGGAGRGEEDDEEEDLVHGAEEEEEEGRRDEENDDEEEEEEGVNGYRCKYQGQRNDRTVKQVNFMGPRSEYVVSGSDCGHIFIWDRHSAKLRQLLHGDSRGAVNCLESHDAVLATCGLEHTAKIWRPMRDEAVPLSELKGRHGESAVEIMQRNHRDRTAPPRGLTPWAGLLMRQALSSVNTSDVRTILAIINSISRASRQMPEGGSDDDDEDDFGGLVVGGDSEEEEDGDSSSSDGNEEGEGGSEVDDTDGDDADGENEQEEEEEGFIGPLPAASTSN